LTRDGRLLLTVCLPLPSSDGCFVAGPSPPGGLESDATTSSVTGTVSGLEAARGLTSVPVTPGAVDFTMNELRGTTEKQRRQRTVPWGAAAAGIALVLLLEASYFKASSVQAWVPVDLTVLGAVLAAVGGVIAWVRSGMAVPRGFLAMLLLFLLLMFPGVLGADLGRHYSETKELGLWLTALCALAPLFLMRSHRHRAVFIVAVAAAGLAFVVLARISPELAGSSGRFALGGGSTIAAGRVAGAGMLALAYLTLRRSVPLLWRVVGLAGVAALGLVMFQSGSRGPLVAVVAAIILAVLFGPARRGGSPRTRLRTVSPCSGAG
jgi:peptidoglycan/LPS O-acetylase OafA/YrhL